MMAVQLRLALLFAAHAGALALSRALTIPGDGQSYDVSEASRSIEAILSLVGVFVASFRIAIGLAWPSTRRYYR